MNPRTQSLLRFAWLPIPLLFGVILLLRAFDLPYTVTTMPYLSAALDLTFRTTIALMIAYLAARAFSRGGALFIVGLGCGMLVIASSSLVSALAVHYREVNFGLTVYNIGLGFSGACHLFAATALIVGTPTVRRARLAVVFAYAGVLLLITLVSLAALEGMFPVFINADGGSENIRQAVLSFAVGAFALAALILVAKTRHQTWVFGRLYAISLALIATGTVGTLIAPEINSLSTWVGRLSIYLGHLYMLGAVIVAGRRSGEWDSILQDAPEHSEQRFETLAEATFEGIMISEGGVVTDVNDQFTRILGFSRTDLIGRPVETIIPSEKDPRLAEPIVTDREGGVERSINRKDGARVVVEAHGRTFTRNGRSIEVLALRDITERKRTEEAFRGTERINEQNLARLNAIVNRMTEGLVIFDPEGNLMEMNPAALKIHGLEKMELIRQNIDQLAVVFEVSDLDGNILSLDKWPIGRVLKGETFSSYEVRVRRIGSEETWIGSFGGTPVYDQHGKIQLAILTLRDVTSHKEAEQALRESELRFRAVVEKSRDGIHQLDLVRGHYTFMSPSAEELTGFTLEEFKALSIQEIIARHHPDDQERVVKFFERIVAGEAPREAIEYRWKIKNGEYRWFSDNRGALCDENGKVHSLVGVSRDITARKQEEEALHKLREELEKRVEERTAELKQRADQLARLTSELTLTEQRERGRLAQVLHDHLQQLLVGAKYSLTLVSRKLSEEKQAGLESVEHLLNEAISASRSLTVELSPPILHEGGLAAGLHWLARWADQKFGLSVKLDLDESAVTGREDVRILMFQAVRELLMNVAKYAETSEAFVELEKVGENQIRVTVTDHGVGFDPVWIAGRKEDVTGGFGLFSIRERLNLLGGKLTIDSTPGKGAVFTLVAPTGGAGAIKLVAPSARAFATPLSPTHSKVADDRIRILLVDDHATMRQGLSSLLNAENDLIIVGEASDGHEAIEMARQLRPEVILMDFSMPKMDGVATTEIIHREQPHVQIIGLSMYAEDDRAESMLRAGAVGYVTKSGESEVLLNAIRHMAKEASAKTSGPDSLMDPEEPPLNQV